MARKGFTAGGKVEIIPEPQGHRGARGADAEWKIATYVRAGENGMRGWHKVTHGDSALWVPARRIRHLGAGR